MTSRTSNRLTPPQQVYDNYKRIRNSNLILNKTLNEKNIAEFQQYLNESQPINDDESQTRSLIQHLYRKNPNNFCRFLVRSRLSHLILWTEAKCIVRHFGLRGIVYVKWNDNEYECSLHRNVTHNMDGDSQHPSVQRTYENIGRSDFDERGRGERRPYQSRGERGRGERGRGERNYSDNDRRPYQHRDRDRDDRRSYQGRGDVRHDSDDVSKLPEQFSTKSTDDFPGLPAKTSSVPPNTPKSTNDSGDENKNLDEAHSKSPEPVVQTQSYSSALQSSAEKSDGEETDE